MAEAIIKGLLSSKIVAGSDIHVSDVDEKRLGLLKSTLSVSVYSDNNRVAKSSEIIILSVKPQNMAKVVKEIEVDEGKLVISIAAGITLEFLEKAFPGKAVVRAMPNNPALVGAGITALAKGKDVSAGQFEQAKKIFKSVGEVVEIEEKLMDAVTGLSGSGPAYVYLMIESLTEAGVSLGLDEKAAQELAVQTVLGAAKTMAETNKSAQELKEMVTSPGGTTIEGLKVLEKFKFKQAIIEAVKAAAKKSKKLSQ